MEMILILIGLAAFAMLFERIGYFSGYDKGFDDALDELNEELNKMLKEEA